MIFEKTMVVAEILTCELFSLRSVICNYGASYEYV